MVGAAFTTAMRPQDIQVYVGLDDDDASYDDVVWCWPVRSVTGPRRQLADWTNHLLSLALADGHDIIASFGDDHQPRTQGWDLQVREAFERMGPGLVYTRDGLQDELLPTAPFWSADILRELGWLYLPVLQHLYADNFWLRLAHDINRCRYLPDVLIEHMHPSIGKAEMDDVYRENDTHFDGDREAFLQFVGSNDYLACVRRVRAIL